MLQNVCYRNTCVAKVVNLCSASLAVHELEYDGAADRPAQLQPHQREPVLRLQGYGHEEAFHGNREREVRVSSAGLCAWIAVGGEIVPGLNVTFMFQTSR